LKAKIGKGCFAFQKEIPELTNINFLQSFG